MSELQTVAAPVPAYFFSDAHLGALHGNEETAQQAKLESLLLKIRNEAKSVFIVGDLFDFWFEWKYVIPKRHFAILSTLRQLAESGIKIHYLAGNHDFRLHGFLEQTIGLQVHHNSLAVQIGSQKLFVYHGDGILKRDSGYRAMKHILRSNVAQKIFSWIHPDIGIALARGTSVTSRKARKENPKDDQEYLDFAKTNFADGFDAVILGHTHRPVETRDGQKTYINLGDWMTHFTYAVHDGSTLVLHRL